MNPKRKGNHAPGIVIIDESLRQVIRRTRKGLKAAEVMKREILAKEWLKDGEGMTLDEYMAEYWTRYTVRTKKGVRYV